MKLIAIDLDGTLLSADGTISEENRNMIYDVQHRGDMVTICSGRSVQDIYVILQKANICCPIIAANGAIIYDGKNIISEVEMDIGTAKSLTNYLFNSRYYFEIYTMDGIQMSISGKDILIEESEAVRQKMAENGKDNNKQQEWEDWVHEQIAIQLKQNGIIIKSSFEDMLKSLQNSSLKVYKIFVLSFDSRKLGKLRNRLAGNRSISVTTSGWTKLEIAHPSVNKGAGLRTLAKHYGISMDNTVAIGDNLNDLPMFQVVGNSIAMGNASDKIKEKCTHTTKSCHDNGVAYALKYYV